MIFSDYWAVSQIAKAYRIQYATVHKRIRTRAIPKVWVGKQLFIHKDHVPQVLIAGRPGPVPRVRP